MNSTSLAEPKTEGNVTVDAADDAWVFVYDVGLFPFALGDVLTWNIQTECRAREAGKDLRVLLVADRDSGPSVFQQQLSGEIQRSYLYNLLPSFYCHPHNPTVEIVEKREVAIARIQNQKNALSTRLLGIYDKLEREGPASCKEDVSEVFSELVAKHAYLNSYHANGGEIPHLRVEPEWISDVWRIFERTGRMEGKRRVVALHPRLRGLNPKWGLAGEARNVNMVLWSEFLDRAAVEQPETLFVLMGELFDYPYDMLERPNAMSLRQYGGGLQHDLAVMHIADLFMGGSSGFAAFANFSATPYLIFGVTELGHEHYGIDYGTPQLPFANLDQRIFTDRYAGTSEDLLNLAKEQLHESKGRSLEFLETARQEVEAKRAASNVALPQSKAAMKNPSPWSIPLSNLQSVLHFTLVNILHESFRGNPEEARRRLTGLQKLFPELKDDCDVALLRLLMTQLNRQQEAGESAEALALLNQLQAEPNSIFSGACHLKGELSKELRARANRLLEECLDALSGKKGPCDLDLVRKQLAAAAALYPESLYVPAVQSTVTAWASLPLPQKLRQRLIAMSVGGWRTARALYIRSKRAVIAMILLPLRVFTKLFGRKSNHA